jgi:hypothetical protein
LGGREAKPLGRVRLRPNRGFPGCPAQRRHPPCIGPRIVYRETRISSGPFSTGIHQKIENENEDEDEHDWEKERRSPLVEAPSEPGFPRVALPSDVTPHVLGLGSCIERLADPLSTGIQSKIEHEDEHDWEKERRSRLVG